MNLSKLQSAISPITQRLADAVSANVSVCQSLSPPKDEKSKTNPNSRGPRELSGRQLAAAGLLVVGSVADVARTLRISERSIFRWKHDPRFQQEIRQRANQVGRLSAVTTPTASPQPAPKKRTFDLDAYCEEIRRGLR